MARFTGDQGSVTVTSSAWGTGVVSANLYRWTFTLDVLNADVTGYASSGWREFIAGLRSGQGTIEMFADDTTALSLSASANPTVTLTLKGSRNLSGAAVLTQLSTGTDGNGGDAARVMYAFRFTSTITAA